MKRFYRAFLNYGFAGVLMFFKLQFRMTKNLSVPKILHPIRLRPATTDIDVFDQIFISKEYDVPIGFEAETIIDAGANIGLAAIFFANRFPNSKIISIEPEPENFKLLQKNTKPYSNVTPINRALSNKRESLTIFDSGTGSWGFATSRELVDKSKMDEIDSVQTVTVPGLMDQNDIEILDIVKIDIEGFEKELFESNVESWLPKTRFLIIELHDWIKHGASKSFFNAISKYDFNFDIRGENLIFSNNQLRS